MPDTHPKWESQFTSFLGCIWTVPKVPDVTLKGWKLIFYVKGKDELMKVEIMKEKDKDFMCLIQVMICDKKLGVTKQFSTVLYITCKKGTV